MSIGTVAKRLVRAAKRYRRSREARQRLKLLRGVTIADKGTDIVRFVEPMFQRTKLPWKVKDRLKDHLDAWVLKVVDDLRHDRFDRGIRPDDPFTPDAADRLLVHFINFASLPANYALIVEDIR